MVGWHYRLNGQFEHSPGGGKGQENLACCSPWGCKDSDTTDQLNCTVDFYGSLGNLGLSLLMGITFQLLSDRYCDFAWEMCIQGSILSALMALLS